MIDAKYPEIRTVKVGPWETSEILRIMGEVADAAGLSVGEETTDLNGTWLVKCQDRETGSLVCTIKSFTSYGAIKAYIEFGTEHVPSTGPTLLFRISRGGDDDVEKAANGFSRALEEVVAFRLKSTAASVRTLSTIVALSMKDVLGRVEDIPEETRFAILAEYEDVVEMLRSSGVSDLNPGLSVIDEWRQLVSLPVPGITPGY
jgi:hypothetical protein